MADVRRQKPKNVPSLEPDTDDRLPTIYLRPGEADRILAGHPWVYEGCILRTTRPPADGEPVQVKDHRRRLLGVGFFNSKSKIRVRILSRERVELDEFFFERRLRAALEHRQRFLPGASSYRLVNAEGDLLSGLIVDKYEDVLVLQTSSLGLDQRKHLIVRVLERLLRPRAILERNDMGSRKFEGLPESSGLLSGNLLEAEQSALPVVINGMRFEVNVSSGHKTGLYLDQQVNQALVAGLAKGAKVLDAFTFIGGFALQAAKAGASSVLAVDQSEDAIGIGRRLASANGVASTCTFETANVFDWLRARTAPPSALNPPPPAFDLVILDPPSFTRNRAAVPDALRGYKEIHLRALRILRPGGILATFCCSHHVDARTFETAIGEAAFDAHRPLRRLATYTQGPDHPILPAVPETEYLKGFAYEILP
ncbi:MAG: class I SAM-dependent rRNA methyltransferase [Verrucomicrobiales bacterium]|nr:class I SAM-dependent rRNA methyltransferase [Verrucomicrobiales bacterium]